MILAYVGGFDPGYPRNAVLRAGLSRLGIEVKSCFVAPSGGVIGRGLEIMRVNAFAPLRISTAFLDNVSASEQRKIIAISSGRGSVSKPFLERRAYFYDMSKSALNLGMRKLQSDVAEKGVLIGILAPGIVDTELNNDLRNGVPAIRKLISPEESAAGRLRASGRRTRRSG